MRSMFIRTSYGPSRTRYYLVPINTPGCRKLPAIVVIGEAGEGRHQTAVARDGDDRAGGGGRLRLGPRSVGGTDEAGQRDAKHQEN